MNNTNPSQSSADSQSKDSVLFYFKVKDEEKGPYTLNQLRSMWDAGQITADAVCRNSDSSEWFPIAQRIAREEAIVETPDKNTQSSLQSYKMRLALAEKVKAKPIIRKITTVAFLLIGVISLYSGIFANKEAIKNDMANSRMDLDKSSDEGRVFNNNYGDNASRIAAAVENDLLYNGDAAESVIEGRIARGIFFILLSSVVWFKWTRILNVFPYVCGLSGLFGVALCVWSIYLVGGGIWKSIEQDPSKILGTIIFCGIMFAVGVIFIKRSMSKTQKIIQNIRA